MGDIYYLQFDLSEFVSSDNIVVGYVSGYPLRPKMVHDSADPAVIGAIDPDKILPVSDAEGLARYGDEIKRKYPIRVFDILTDPHLPSTAWYAVSLDYVLVAAHADPDEVLSLVRGGQKLRDDLDEVVRVNERCSTMPIVAESLGAAERVAAANPYLRVRKWRGELFRFYASSAVRAEGQPVVHRATSDTKKPGGGSVSGKVALSMIVRRAFHPAATGAFQFICRKMGSVTRKLVSLNIPPYASERLTVDDHGTDVGSDERAAFMSLVHALRVFSDAHMRYSPERLERAVGGSCDDMLVRMADTSPSNTAVAEPTCLGFLMLAAPDHLAFGGAGYFYYALFLEYLDAGHIDDLSEAVMNRVGVYGSVGRYAGAAGPGVLASLIRRRLVERFSGRSLENLAYDITRAAFGFYRDDDVAKAQGPEWRLGRDALRSRRVQRIAEKIHKGIAARCVKRISMELESKGEVCVKHRTSRYRRALVAEEKRREEAAKKLLEASRRRRDD